MATFHASAPSISDEQSVDEIQKISAGVVTAYMLGILGIVLATAIFGT